MRRVHGIELEDLPRFPNLIRQAMVTYLRLATELSGQTEKIRPVIESALEQSGERAILDLCSGGGGPILSISEAMRADGRELTVTLTDHHPEAHAREVAEASGRGSVRYESEPVDALEGVSKGEGLRTLFNGFHHFRPDYAERVLRSVVTARQPIAIVEVMRRRSSALFGIILIPLVVLFVVPLLRPFRWQWLPLTYLLPVIPLSIMWDGLFSCLRIYEPDDLQQLIRAADPDETFDWRIEAIDLSPIPVPGLALVGIPRERLTEG